MSVSLPPLPVEDLDHVLAHTRELWTEAKGAAFFITGGTGFFGIWLLESFAHVNDRLGLGMRVTVLTRDPAAFARKVPHLAARGELTFITGDMRDFVFPAESFRYVIHAASDTSIPQPGADPAPIRDAIVAGTRHVLDFAVQADARKFLLTSSGAVYGTQPQNLTHMPEDFPPRPITGYGLGKLAAEELALSLAAETGFECKIARCYAFVGPHLPLDAHFAVGNFIRDALAAVPIRIGGDGTPTRSYLYAADLAVWLWTVLFCGAPGRAYNVGSDESSSIAGVADAVQRALGLPSAIRCAQAARPGQPASRYVPTVARAREELGLEVYIPLEEGIRRTSVWHRGKSLSST